MLEAGYQNEKNTIYIPNPPEKRNYVEQLKQLKDSLGPVPPHLNQLRKDHVTIQKAILKAVEHESKTPPEIAKEINEPVKEVFWHINALRKYNQLEIDKKSGDYYTYKIKE